MKIAELRAKSSEELKDIILTSKKEQFNLRMQAAAGSLENRQGIKKARRTIARAKTLLNEENKNAKSATPKKVRAKKEKKG
ncbi:MAG: 50S ribosomal protein L29 [Rickettsiales bacterium]